MKYYYEKPELYFVLYGKTYTCDHPVYNCCTLYLIRERGLAVIQQRFNSETKSTFWTEIDPWLIDDIYMHPNFEEFFNKYAKNPQGDIYPTVTVRQIMWGLKMKPLKRERWETVFDRHDI